MLKLPEQQFGEFAAKIMCYQNKFAFDMAVAYSDCHPGQQNTRSYNLLGIQLNQTVLEAVRGLFRKYSADLFRQKEKLHTCWA